MAKRADSNQPEVVDALRQAGWFVFHTHIVGRGFPDLVIGREGLTLLVEIKATEKSRFSDQELAFMAEWTGNPIVIAFNGSDAVNKCRARLMQHRLKRRLKARWTKCHKHSRR